jgi:hypothetical protein
MSSYHKLKRDEAQAQRLYAATKDPATTPSRTYANSTTQEPYKTPVWNIRAGAGELSTSGRGV